MKSIILKTMAAAAIVITTAGANTALADPIFITPDDGTFFNYTFSDSFDTATQFVDEFLFGSPPPSASFSLFFGPSASVTFSSVVLTIFGDDQPILLDGSFGPDGGLASTFSPLDSAAYLLTVSGFSTDGGSYLGTLLATATDYQADPPVPAVPEPSSAALLLLGLGLVGSAWRAHARKAKQTSAFS